LEANETINFNTTKKKVNMGNIITKKILPPWNSLDLIETLFNLVVDEKTYDKSLSIFESQIKKIPEQLIIGVSEASVHFN
jgi:hypothetical protein